MKKIIQNSILLLIIQLNTNAQSLTGGNTGYQKKSTIQFRTAFMEDSIIQRGTDHDYYMKKSSRKKTAAWLLLSGGALCTGIGLLAFPEDYDLLENSSATESQADFSVALTVVGIAAMATSIPFFISGSINKHKAQAGFDYKKTALGIPVRSDKEIAGLTLSISLGK